MCLLKLKFIATMKLLIKTSILFMLFTTFIFSSCKQSTDKASKTDTTDKLTQEEVKKGVEAVVFPLPEPMSVYQMLQEIGASYFGEVLNPVGNVENYFTANVKAVNLGVYAADISYATVYDMKDDVDTYSKTLKKLVDDLGIKIDYLKLTSEETKAKAENLDSLVSLTSELFYDIYEFLYKESDPALAAQMVNGFYIEGIYIATHISEATFDNVEMIKIIYGQAKPLEELIKLNDNFADDQYIQTIQSALKKLKALYDETDGSLSQEQLDGIKAAVETIRDSFVS